MKKPLSTCPWCEITFETPSDVLEQGSRWRICSSQNLWFQCNSCEHTLKIDSGRHDWFVWEDQLGEEAKKFYSKYNKRLAIPLVPSKIMELNRLIEQENSSATDIAKRLEQIPSIATVVLGIASHLNPQGIKITNLTHAISLVGRLDLSNIIMHAVINSPKLKTKNYTIEEYAEESKITAQIARLLWNEYGEGGTEEGSQVYYCGYFASVGKLMLALCFPEKMDEAKRMVSDVTTQCTWEEAFAKINAPKTEMLAEIAVTNWGLHNYVKNTVTHIDDNFDESGKLSLVESVALARILAFWVLHEPQFIDQSKLDYFKARLNMDENEVSEMVESLSEKLIW